MFKLNTMSGGRFILSTIRKSRIHSSQRLVQFMSSIENEDSWSTSSSSDDETPTPPKTKTDSHNHLKRNLVYEKFEPNPNVPGLSSQVVLITDQEVMKGVSKKGVYKNPEYFSYHPMSFYNAEVELIPYRLPQPSPFDPLKPDPC